MPAKSPRTVEIIMCRTLKCAALWNGSIRQLLASAKSAGATANAATKIRNNERLTIHASSLSGEARSRLMVPPAHLIFLTTVYVEKSTTQMYQRTDSTRTTSSKCLPWNSAGRLWATIHPSRSAHAEYATQPHDWRQQGL